MKELALILITIGALCANLANMGQQEVLKNLEKRIHLIEKGEN